MGATKETCLCGIHVHLGTKVVGWITIVSSVVLIVPLVVLAIFSASFDVEEFINQNVKTKTSQFNISNLPSGIIPSGISQSEIEKIKKNPSVANPSFVNPNVVSNPTIDPKIIDQYMKNSSVNFDTEIEAIETFNHYLFIACIVCISSLILGCILTGLMLIGVSKKCKGLYTPYLIWTVIQIVTTVLLAGFLLITSIVLFNYDVKNPEQKNLLVIGGILVLVNDLLVILTIPILVYFGFIVVNRSKKILGKETHDNFGQVVPVASTASYHQAY